MAPLKLAFAFPFLLFLSGSSFSQNSFSTEDSISFRPEVERLFVDAMRLFTAGRYDSAAALFAKSIRDYPRSHRSTGAYIMGAKAHYQLGNYREAVRYLKDLIDLYPDSRYIPDAHYTLGVVFYKQARFEDAGRELIQSFQQAVDARLRSRSQALLEMITRTYLSIAQLQLLIPDAKNEEMRALIDLRIAEKVYALGDVKSAQEMLRSVSGRPATIKYVGEALSLLQKYEKGGILKIGVVLPLMLKAETSAARELGVELLDGVRLAVDEYNQESLPRIELDIRDSERDPSVSARQVTELCNDDKVVAIIGPVFSNEVFASAGIANARGVPMVTPTATANGIAAIGGYVFQANPDYEVRGRAMARYAFTSLKDSVFAVFSPLEPPGKLIAEAFIDEVKLLGGEMIDVQWYQAGATDLRSQLEAMRRKALEKTLVPFVDFSKKIKHTDVNKMVVFGVRQQFLDSLMEVGGTAPVDVLFGKNGKRVADSLGIETQMPVVKFDSLGLPVTNIQAIFIPLASSEEIGVVGPQLKFFNFQARILGTGEWQDPVELDQHRQYVDSVIFSVDSYWDERAQPFKIFQAKIMKATNKKPTKNTLYGYDAMKALLKVVQQGSSHKNEIAANLAQLRDFPGIHSKISFVNRRVNSHLTILQYRSRSIRRIGDVDLAPPALQSP
jgi:ABC-type branched-subunit amino acid transport system substrate-binding protein